jgi:hypothetical protein
MKTMIKTIVSLETNLASSIALKYACRLANLIDIELHTIHVKEPDSEGQSLGSGWVRKTWEDTMRNSEQAEIHQMIKAELASYPRLGSPKMSVGNREKEIFYELQSGFYDLFVEGALHTFNSSPFYSKIHSWFYRNTPCPIILVKNLVNLEKVLLVLSSEVNYAKLISKVLKFFKGVNVELDLIYFDFNRREKSVQSKGEDPDTILRNAEKILSENEMPPAQCRVVQNSSNKAAELIQGYGLVASSIYRQTGKRGPLLELLSRTPYPLLLCWQ